MEEAGEVREHRDHEGEHRDEVEPAGVCVAAVLAVQVVDVELALAQQEVVDDQDPTDGPQQRRVPDEPGEDVIPRGLEQLPREHHESEPRRNVAAEPEGDSARVDVDHRVRGRDHVGCEVGRQGGHAQREQRHHDGEAAPHLAQQLRRIPDRLAVDDFGGPGHRDSNEGEQRHRRGQADRLPEDLVALALRVSGEVGDVERERGPKADHRGERGEERRPELPLLRPSGIELARRVDHRPEAARLDIRPCEQRQPHEDQKRGRELLEDPNRLHALVDEVDLDRPEPEEAQQLGRVDAHEGECVARQRSRRNDVEQLIDRRSADPRLDPEPTARHQCAQERRHMRPDDAEARPRQDRETGCRTSCRDGR